MTPPTGSFALIQQHLLAWLQEALLWLLRTLGSLLAWLRAFATSRRPWSFLGRLLAAAAGACAVLAGVQVILLVYGHFALAHEARNGAQQCLLKGEDQVLRNLRRTAFKLGFPEAALEPGVFTFTYPHEDGLPTCGITYDFVHVVNCYGLAKLPIRFHHEVIRPMAEPPAPLDPDQSER